MPASNVTGQGARRNASHFSILVVAALCLISFLGAHRIWGASGLGRQTRSEESLNVKISVPQDFKEHVLSLTSTWKNNRKRNVTVPKVPEKDEKISTSETDRATLPRKVSLPGKDEEGLRNEASRINIPKEVSLSGGDENSSKNETDGATVSAEDSLSGKEENSSKNGTHKATRLTKERVLELAPDGYLLVTMANHHFLSFVLNWVYHIEMLEITAYVVGAMDDVLHAELDERGINSFDLGSDMTTNDFLWGSKTFFQIGTIKVGAILKFLDMGINVIFTDVDAIWLRNPIPFWKEHSRADVLMSTDGLDGTHIDGQLDNPIKSFSGGNIGVLMFKPSAMAFVEEWLEMLMADEKLWDQNAFNDLRLVGRELLPDDPDHLFSSYNGTLMMGLLPVTQFCSGHTFFAQGLPQQFNLRPYIVHATFQFAGTPGKRHRFREALLWDDPPEYFDRPNGFMLYDPNIPQELLENAAPKFPKKIWLNDTLGHFDLVNYQLTQVRHALSIARTLNRTLIMPELWCGHDHIHFPHPGAPGGADSMILPYQCPLDHVFNVDFMVPEPPEEPFVDIKESSFLRNRRLPDSVRKSILRVDLCTGEDSNCGSDGQIVMNGTIPVLHIKPNLTDVEIQAALGTFTSHKILHFSSMGKIFGGFQQNSTAMEFKDRTKQFTGQWCCVTGDGPGKPGHVWYDLYHDVIPHTDYWKREVNTTWKPILGP